MSGTVMMRFVGYANSRLAPEVSDNAGNGMKTAASMALCALALNVFSALPSLAQTRMWVGVDDLRRHSCPSIECGIVGRLFFRESVVVYQTKDGWSRISGYGTAGCHDGKAAFVQSGRNDCSKENGISKDEFAEWVDSSGLAAEKPNQSQDLSANPALAVPID